MTDFRARYVATARAGLAERPGGESAVDIVHAAGRADSIGINIWRGLYGLDGMSYRDIRKDALRAFRSRYPREDLAERIVDQAIHEFAGPGCAECGGTGKVGSLDLNAPQATCPACNGTKVKHYTDTVRAAMMGISYGKTKHLAFKIAWATRYLQDHDRAANAGMNVEMERD